MRPQAWNIFSAPGALLALWVTERYGLRVAVLAGVGSQLCCCSVSWGACLLPVAPQSAYALLYAAQCAGALGQPLLLNNVARLAGDWCGRAAQTNAAAPRAQSLTRTHGASSASRLRFPAHERDVAVTVAVLCVAAGSVVIGLLAPAIVVTPHDVQRVFGWQARRTAAGRGRCAPCGVCPAGPACAPLPARCGPAAQVPAWMVVTALTGAFLSNSPPEPPSAAAELQRQLAAAANEDDATTATSTVIAQALTLVRDTHFMLMVWAVSILTGLCYGLLTLVGELLAPCGASNALAGGATAVCAAATAGGCCLYALLLGAAGGGDGERGADQRPYAKFFTGFSTACAVSVCAVLATAARGVPAAVQLAAWAVLGFASGPLMGPLPLEYGAEMTFPVPANASTTVLALVGSVVSFLQVVAATPLLEMRHSALCVPGWTAFDVFCVANVCVGLAIALSIQHTYRRQARPRAPPHAPCNECAPHAHVSPPHTSPRRRRRRRCWQAAAPRRC